MITKKIGWVGCGNMGGAILHGALESGVISKDDAIVYDIKEEMMDKAKGWGAALGESDADVCGKCDIVLLAVKPQQAKEALAQCGEALDGKALISIVAGVTVERLRGMISGNARILRVMPNTPAMVFEGAFALCADNDLASEEMAAAEELFRSIGVVEKVPETLIDAVCGLSGGGPAYVAMFIEAMADGGVACGLTRPMAMECAAQTLIGAARLMLETGRHPGALKDAVCSPGGATIQGVRALEAGGFRSAVMEAVIAAYEKSAEMK